MENDKEFNDYVIEKRKNRIRKMSTLRRIGRAVFIYAEKRRQRSAERLQKRQELLERREEKKRNKVAKSAIKKASKTP